MLQLGGWGRATARINEDDGELVGEEDQGRGKRGCLVVDGEADVWVQW